MEDIKEKIIHGTLEADRLYGGNGNTKIYGSAGDDYLNGMDGNDTLFGSAGNDTLIASDGWDFLYGGTGNDALVGGSGTNTLDGGDGNDYFLIQSNNGFSSETVLILGTGRDTIAWKSRAEEGQNWVEIEDFNPKEDRIILNGSKSDYQLSEVNYGIHGTEISVNDSAINPGKIFIEHQLDMSLNASYFSFAENSLI